ncbi:MAG: four helix bundle protein [Prevotella sp.]|nr:four helix bundle protein [Prevotella sp.]
MKNKEDNLIVIKSYNFGIRCVKLRRYLVDEKREYDISKQLLRSGTSIGANIKEAIRGQSKPDFKAKMNISLKEASESEYWIELLRDTEYINEYKAKSLLDDCVEIIKILTKIVKTTDETAD